MWACAREECYRRLSDAEIMPWDSVLKLSLKLPPLRHPVKSRMALERPHARRKQAEANRATAVAVVNAVDQRREFLAPVVVGREEVRLMPAGGHQVEQHDADAQRLVPRHAPPEVVEAAEQKAGVAGFLKGDFI